MGQPAEDRLVLVVDDEAEWRGLVRDALEREHFAVAEAGTWGEAQHLLERRTPAMVVLDLGLPDRGGLDVLGDLRRSGGPPVIVLSGRGDETDRILGLELGADDYVVKPCSLRELVARVKVVLRRPDPATTSVVERLEFGELEIDLPAREVTLDGAPVVLTTREFDLLVHLAASPRRVFSAEQLLAQVWRSEPGWQSPATVGEHVYRIRKKLAEAGGGTGWIETVRNAGYRFTGASRG